MRTFALCIAIITGALIINDGISMSNLSAQERIELKEHQKHVESQIRKAQQETDNQLAKEKADELVEQERILEKAHTYGTNSLSNEEYEIFKVSKVEQTIKVFELLVLITLLITIALGCLRRWQRATQK